MYAPFDPYYQWLGIPPEEQPPNHYQLLGIKWFEDNPEVISAAADRQVLHLRTYQIGDYSDFSQRLLGEVITAKQCLLDEKRKSAYDQWLLEGDLQKSLDSQGAAGTARFGPQLEALFEDAQQSQPAVLPRRPKKGRRLPSRRIIALSLAVAGVLLVVCVLAFAASWLVESVAARLGGESEPVETAGAEKQTAVTQNGAGDKGPSEVTKPKTTDRPGSSSDAGDIKGLPKEARQEPPDDKKKPAVKPDGKSEAAAGWHTVEANAPSPLESVAPVRLPVPSDEERFQARAGLEQRFHMSQARMPIDKIRLARQLLRSNRGMGAAEDAIRFEMLDQASKLAAESGSYELSLAVIDEIGDRFDIDPMAAKQARLFAAAAAANDPGSLQQLSIAAVKLIDEAVEQKHFDVAERVIDIALSACKGPAGKDFRKTFIERRKDIRTRQQQSESIQSAAEKLKNSPHDGPANLLLGAHYCFENGDWQRGLPFLAKGSDAGLARVAKIELEDPPQNAAEEIALADLWWKLAASKSGPLKKPIMLRAAHWYRQAQSKLTSGHQVKHVDRRLETIMRLTEEK